VLATGSAAQTFSLDFIHLHSERYDLVMRKRYGGSAAVKALPRRTAASHAATQVGMLAGYDTSETGTLVA